MGPFKRQDGQRRFLEAVKILRIRALGMAAELKIQIGN